MKSITIKYDENSKEGKIVETLLDFFENEGMVEVLEKSTLYNQEFVTMIKDAANSENRTELNDVDELWESLN